MKHSPSSSPLCRPSAGFGASRAITFFAPFDPILLIDILHRSTNPQTFILNYLRALIWLNITSNGQQEDSDRTEKLSQKSAKNDENYEKFYFHRIKSE